MSSFLDQYEPLDIIGNGSFGIIRKVRRKADGTLFARKELNFERMSERDRKQIVAEVNILKDLHHEHIVRYHDRHVDRDAGILYILMEYCGGGDLSTIIKQATRTNRPIPEDNIWHYFMQILLALHYCHHPNGHSRSGSGSGLGPGFEAECKERRVQILHRDLKPDNVFLDENNVVKLGDFGLSKALAQSSFANTYVGTPYYMSPELMQEKAYDSKSDIWSLGCLIYELCALKPPFHEAKTHAELSIFIRNGRIPPLPRGYSQSLSAVIKAMLNLNPAMRPSAAQLLQHERLEFQLKVADTDKLLTTVKHHKSSLIAKERELIAREETIKRREHEFSSILSGKDAEINRLQALVNQMQQQQRFTQHDVEIAVKQAVSRREEELRILITKREAEVAAAMVRREEEIMEAVRRREMEVCEAWTAREAEIRNEVEVSIKAVQERLEWITKKEEEIQLEEERIEELREELDEKMETWEDMQKGKTQKSPLEEVQNLPEPLNRISHETPVQRRPSKTQATPKNAVHPFASLQTPITRPNYTNTLPSAMKGVVLTTTGEVLATPTPAELAKLFNQSPQIGLNFTKIFEFEKSSSQPELNDRRSSISSEEDLNSPPPSPSTRKEKERKEKDDISDTTSSTSSGSTSTIQAKSSTTQSTRLRRPSSRGTIQHAPLKRATSGPTLSSSRAKPSTTTAAKSTSAITTTNSSKPTSATSAAAPKPTASANNSAKPTTSAKPTSMTRTKTAPLPAPKSHPVPQYDLADEENLPSPFLKRPERDRLIAKTNGLVPSTVTGGGSLRVVVKKRPSTGNYLRAVAAANAVGKRNGPATNDTAEEYDGTREVAETNMKTRPALVNARKAGENARRALTRS